MPNRWWGGATLWKESKGAEKVPRGFWTTCLDCRDRRLTSKHFYDGKKKVRRGRDGRERWKLETCMGWRENEIAKIPPFHEGKLSSKQKAITSLWGGHKNENNKQSNHACVYACIPASLCGCVFVAQRSHTWSSVCTNKRCVHVFMYGDY